MNCTLSKAAPDGLKPYQCQTGKKPNLSILREWGSKVWVCTKKKDKLGGQRVEEGRWVGVNVKSKVILLAKEKVCNCGKEPILE
jgi:hypothetical protein